MTGNVTTYNTTRPDISLTYPETSTIPLGQVSQLTIISGGNAAMIVAPTIQVRWQSNDQVVMDWLKSQSVPGMAPLLNRTAAPTPVPQHHSLSAGKIAGLVNGAVIGLGLIVKALALFEMLRVGEVL
jgi:hypothetical protein